MAKEKHLKFESEKKDLTFYYEIVGIIALIIPVLGFARLGAIGFYIMLVFKIIFGDWYFLFLLAIFCYGLRCLIYHKPMNFKTMRIIGIFLILIGVMMLSHFPMHNYIVSFDTEGTGGYYSKTLALYLDYFKNYYDGMVVGGGIVGSSFFYLFHSLLSGVGTTFMIIVFVFVGLVFFTEKTINEFVGFFVRGGVKMFNFFKKRFKSFKYEIVVPKSVKRSKQISINSLKDPVLIKYEGFEQTKSKEIKEKLISILNRMNVFYNDIIVHIGYNVTTYTIDSIQYIDLNKLNQSLKDFVEHQFMIKKEVKTKKTIIEVNNTYDSLVEVKTVLEIQKNYLSNFVMPIGITSLNNLIDVNFENEVGLLLEDQEHYANDFINGFIILNYIKNSPRKFKITYIDKTRTIDKISKNKSIEEITTSANQILSDLTKNQSTNIYEYNERAENKEKHKIQIFIINNINDIIKGEEDVERLTFLFQVATKIGYFFIIITNNKKSIPQVIENYLQSNIYFKDSVNLDIANKLKVGEAFYIQKDIIERVTLISMENKEFDKFKEYL